MSPSTSKTFYVIPVLTAARYTKRWRETSPKVKAFTIDVAELNDIVKELNGSFRESPITRIRVYFGIKDDGQEALVLTGVDREGSDIVNYVNAQELETAGTYDFTHPCPDTCDDTSILSTDI